MTGDHVGDALPDNVEQALAQKPARRHKHVRVTTATPAGSDPHPAPEEPRGSGTENDTQLRADKPPHWG